MHKNNIGNYIGPKQLRVCKWNRQ